MADRNEIYFKNRGLVLFSSGPGNWLMFIYAFIFDYEYFGKNFFAKVGSVVL